MIISMFDFAFSGFIFFTSTVQRIGQHFAQRKLTEKDQKLLNNCRFLISEAIFT